MLYAVAEIDIERLLSPRVRISTRGEYYFFLLVNLLLPVISRYQVTLYILYNQLLCQGRIRINGYPGSLFLS